MNRFIRTLIVLAALMAMAIIVAAPAFAGRWPGG
jgi:hypothetical protein